jgi:predicted HAD superfamily Cof-like phosphohydrolase
MYMISGPHPVYDIMEKADKLSVGESIVEFHKAFKCAQNRAFTHPSITINDTELLLLRKSLIREEVEELFEAIDEGKKTHILKELVDIVVVCIGMADTYGWNFDEAFKQVHISNMSKLDNNGQPIYRKDGKVLKSDNYVPPNLSDLV